MNVNRRYKLVALDNDLDTLREIAEAVSSHYDVIRCRDAVRAIGACEADPDVRAIVTEHVMHAAAGTSVLEFLRARRPLVRRVMLTTYADLAAIVNGLHTGAIQHLVHKPVYPPELLAAVVPNFHPIATAERMTA